LRIAVVNIIAQLPVSNNIAQLPGLAPGDCFQYYSSFYTAPLVIVSVLLIPVYNTPGDCFQYYSYLYTATLVIVFSTTHTSVQHPW